MKIPQHPTSRFDRAFLDFDPVMLLSTLLVGALLTALVCDGAFTSGRDVVSVRLAEGARQ